MSLYAVYYLGRGDMPEYDEETRAYTPHGLQIAHLRGVADEADIEKIPDREELLEEFGYTLVAHAVGEPDDIFHHYQADFMTDLTARRLRALNTTHTSMSVGDLLVCQHTGAMLFCEPYGWKEMN